MSPQMQCYAPERWRPRRLAQPPATVYPGFTCSTDESIYDALERDVTTGVKLRF